MERRKEAHLIDYYFDAAMAKVTGEAVAVWMLIACFAGVAAYILYRRGMGVASTVGLNSSKTARLGFSAVFDL